MIKFVVLFSFVLQLSFSNVWSQQKLGIDIINAGTNTSLRGMSVPSETVIWVSGSNGTIGKSTDAGKSWRWMTVPGFEKRDFRDIEAFDSSTAIIMAIDNPGSILKTMDGGATWKRVFEKSMNGMFLDAMDFKNEKEGVCVGDPVAIAGQERKCYYVIKTYDGGNTWSEVPPYQLIPAELGAAIFSASGTNISFLNRRDFEYAFVTGGLSSHLIMVVGHKEKPGKTISLPILQHKASAGAFSLATNKQRRYYVIGGDYKLPEDDSDNFYFSLDAGKRWRACTTPPFGYRSCIKIIKNKTMVACGATGVDFAKNAHKKWEKVSGESFNVCAVSKNGKVFLAGEKGKIGRLLY